VVGGRGASRDELARLLARQVAPRAGLVKIGGDDLTALPDSVTGRRIGYAGPETYLGSGSFHDALIYPLLRRPAPVAPDAVRDRAKAAGLREAARTGNSLFDLDADWIDYAAAGCRRTDDLRWRIIELLRVTELEMEIYELGMRRTIDPALRRGLADQVLAARRLLRERVQNLRLDAAVESFDRASRPPSGLRRDGVAVEHAAHDLDSCH
jgi:hypothetical protein